MSASDGGPVQPSSNTIRKSTSSAPRSRSPQRPPISPITSPTTAPADWNAIPPPQQHAPLPPPKFIAQPAPVPIPESDNPDALALRSAISVLQLQREKSRRDIKMLEQIRQAAMADPQAFVEELASGRLKTGTSSEILGPTLQSAIEALRASANTTSTPTATAPAPAPAAPHPTERDEIPETQSSLQNLDSSRPASSSSSDSSTSQSFASQQQQTSKFPPLPQPQNIVRTPAINWAKYHVVGTTLDKMHAEQLARPTAGAPSTDTAGPVRAPLHHVAAPYSPFADRLDRGAGGGGAGGDVGIGSDHPMQTRKGSKKPPG